MLQMHPRLVEELVSLVDDYAALEASNRDYVRATLKAQTCYDRIRILGNTRIEKPPLAQLFDLMTVGDLLMELQVTETIRITYHRDEKPQVFYWERRIDGTNGGAR